MSAEAQEARRLKHTRRECPVCGCCRAKIVHFQTFLLADDHPLPDRYDVVCCDECGAGFADTPVSQSVYDDYYARQSRYAAGPAAHVASERDLKRFQRVAADISRAVPDKTARVADIGCANGLLLRALADAGYTDLCGVDPSDACAREAAQTTGANVLVGSIMRMPEAIGGIDVMILSHVLEHVRDLRPALESLKRFLSVGAVVYAEVPDAARYVDFVWSPFQDFNTEHINHLSRLSLANLFRQCGFRPVRFDTKDILSAPGMPYPAVFGFAVMEPGTSKVIEKDSDLAVRLEAYVNVSTELMRTIDARLRRALRRCPSVIVWGTGELTAKLLADSELGRANIVGFVDANPVNHGRTLRGIPVMGPRSVTSPEPTIVVASLLHSAAIKGTIRELGLHNPVLTLDENGSGS